MTAKEELSQYKYKLKRVEESLEEYKRFKERATKMTAIISDNPQRSNLNSDKVGKNAIKMADISAEYEKRWHEAEQERLDLTNKINKLEEPYRTILHMRYIEELGFYEIAEKLGYSYGRTAHMHGEALEKFAK